MASRIVHHKSDRSIDNGEKSLPDTLRENKTQYNRAALLLTPVLIIAFSIWITSLISGDSRTLIAAIHLLYASTITINWLYIVTLSREELTSVKSYRALWSSLIFLTILTSISIVWLLARNTIPIGISILTAIAYPSLLGYLGLQLPLSIHKMRIETKTLKDKLVRNLRVVDELKRGLSKITDDEAASRDIIQNHLAAIEDILEKGIKDDYQRTTLNEMYGIYSSVWLLCPLLCIMLIGLIWALNL